MMGLNARFGIIWTCQYVLALTSTALAVLVGAAVSDPSLAIEVRSMPDCYYCLAVFASDAPLTLTFALLVTVRSAYLYATNIVLGILCPPYIDPCVAPMVDLCVPARICYEGCSRG
jgi:hypothetical protein